MLPLLSTVILVALNTILFVSLPVHSFPLASIVNEYRHAPRVSHIKVRTAGPTHAGIITHPSAQLQQAIFGVEKPEPRHLPLSGLYTRGGLQESTLTILDQFLASNNKQASYYYTLSIEGLGLHNRPDGQWKFFVHIDLAVLTFRDAKGHTKLPQLTVSYMQPHPEEPTSMILGDLLDIYELTEKDILDTIETDEPAPGVMGFLSSRISRMGGFSHKHVGVEEFELAFPRTTDPKAAGHP
ncbi:hypothetical protein ABW20_dc0104418 [Dactylellina cionopaga]|nr:hypothetical protein ABW20_dc0104418 [Dactylellina cionopaga]